MPILSVGMLSLPPAVAETMVQQVEPLSVPPIAKSTDDVTAPTKVYSCAVHFPLNSVRFDESAIAECFSSVDVERISYIHVIATSSPDGTNKHNLYLSARRAGAIEGYLRNRYPETEVHAFGGGENPKFGKMARVFVVESSKDPRLDKAGPEAVIDRTPKIISKTIYRDLVQKPLGLRLNATSGAALYSVTQDEYQYLSLSGSTRIANPWVRHVDLGLRYAAYYSDIKRDIQSLHAYLAKSYRLGRLWLAEIKTGAKAGVGVAYGGSARADVSAAFFAAAEVRNMSAAVELGLAYHFIWVGFSVGALI